VRQSAADALSGGVPDQFLLSAWIEILQQKDAKIEVRRSAAISISRVDEIKDVATLQALTQAFQDEDLGIRQNIAISLWKNKKLDTKNTLKILNEGLLSKDPFIQFDALEELDNIVQFNIHAGLGNMDEEMKPVLPSLITLLQSNIEPLRYSAALLISDIAPQKECVPVLHEILNKEREYPIPDIATDALLNIISSEALNAYIDSLKFTDKEQRYVLSCGGVYGVLGGFLKVPEFFPLLIQALNNENVRSIVASSIIKSDNLKIATPRLIKILENEYEGTPALKEILIFKDKDIRRSIAYALGEIADSDANDDENREENRIVVKDKENEQKIINALTVVVQNQQEDIDIRWMAATSLQKLGINQDSFFTKYNLVNPSTIKCPFPFPYPLLDYSGGLVFDRYSAQCNYAIGGCGASLKGIYIKLRQRLSNRSPSNRSLSNRSPSNRSPSNRSPSNRSPSK
jgi:HEAT repeat protein